MSGLIVDNFAGGGGASTGIEAALNRPVDIAVNHDRDAIDMHRANHPGTLHLCEDVFRVSPREVCVGRTVDVAWFSPDCRHHSNAKAGKPVSRSVRGLAGVALKWAAQVKPRVIFLENVREFREWGPLLPDGTPNKAKSGTSYIRFCARLRNLGYCVEDRFLVAADFGAPTTRTRLYLIARCDGEEIAWPDPTHADPRVHDIFGAGLLPWVGAEACIDRTIPALPAARCDAKIFSAVQRGWERYGRAFVLSYYGNPGVRPIEAPLPTQTTKDRFALIDRAADGTLLHRMLTSREVALAQGFPANYVLTGGHANEIKRIGNSVCPPVAEALVRANCAWAIAQEATA